MLEQKMNDVTFIDKEELPTLLAQVDKIAVKEPKVAEEVKQLIQKFHPSL